MAGDGMSKWGKYYTVGLLTLTSMFLYADQNLISPNLSAVAEDFGFDEREKDLKLGGWLQLAFFVVGSPASLIIGWLSDKMPRTRLFFITVLIGEGPCLATYWVETYWQLFAVRALTGVAVGGCLPLLFSITGDIFPAEERNYVASFLTIATGAGIAVGQIMAGTVGPAEGWRLPFILAAAPAIFLAFVLYLTVKEPKRGAQEEAVKRRNARRVTEELERKGRLCESVVVRVERGEGDEADDDANEEDTGAAAAGALPGVANHPHHGGREGASTVQVDVETAGDDDSRVGRGKECVPVHYGGGEDNVKVRPGRKKERREEGDAAAAATATATTTATTRTGTGTGTGTGTKNEDELNPEEVEDDEYGGKIDMKKLWRQLKIPSNIIILAQGLPGTVPWGMLNAYFVDYLHVQKGLSVEAGTGAVTIFGVGATLGTIFGGFIGQRVYNRPGGRHAIAVVMGVTTALGALPGYFFLNIDSYGPYNLLLYASCLIGGLFAAVTPPNVRAVLLNVNPPETRGTMFAFYSQIDDVGKGGGPALVAGLIMMFGRRFAFNVAISGWLLCGVILLFLARYIDADVANAQRRVQEELDASEAAAAAAAGGGTSVVVAGGGEHR